MRRETIRTITADRGTVFEVFAETESYVMCNEPNNSDTPKEAILDIEDMSKKGYCICYAYHGLGAFILFEKRVKV